MALAKDAVLREIDQILAEHKSLRAKSAYDDCSDQPDEQSAQLMMTISAAIERFGTKGSQYVESLTAIEKTYGPLNCAALPQIIGILRSLRIAYDRGYLSTIEELVHADIFADFLEMAEYLHGEGYKDAAAVIAGSVLEEHLRKLCSKNGIPVQTGGHPRKADALNSDLAARNIYSKLDQKSVTA